jgi:uncharacterized RDD family membrane protein YckC
VAKLIVNPSSSQRREILLPRSVLSIGRDPSNDLVLPDAMVSRRHAVVEWRGSQFYLRDCNSSNGSLVNGDRVSEKGLRDGDLVAIGTARLLFRDEAGEEVGAKVVQHPSAKHLLCPSCGADYRKGDLFCRQCGASLAPAAPAKVVCAACGTAVPLPARFCNACGASLPAGAAAAPAAPPAPPPAEPLPATSGKASPAPALAPYPEPEEEPEVVSEAELHPPSPAPEPSPEPKPPEPESRVAPVLAPPPPPGRLRPFPTSAPARLHALPSRGRSVSSTASSPLLQPARPLASSAPLRAPAGLRLLAAIVDFVVAAILQALPLVPPVLYWWSREIPTDPAQVGFLPILLSLVSVPFALALGAAYFVWGWGVLGATPGKALLGLRVESDDGRSPIGAGRAFVRLLGYAASALPVGLGFVLIPFTGDGLHDKIAGTRVVRREKD